MSKPIIGTILLTGIAVAAGAYAQPTWTQLSLDTCGINAFLAEHPQSDGSGVVIAVLDTGVDPSIPGLTLTPDGAVKVIDVQDFSGEGNTPFHRVRPSADTGALIEYDDDGAAIAFTPPELTDTAKRDYWMGWIEEKKYINASVPDLNDDGDRDDRFAFLVTAVEGDGNDNAVVYVDTDQNRSFAGEKPLRNYKIAFDTFVLSRKRPEQQIVPLTFAVNVFLKQREVVFHFDDGAHGTHVAGIAAGCQINNQDGFNGVAPGAKVISLKIGQNAAGGISTTEAKKKAMEYAARFSREHGVPVVCNLSYGVESTIEGNSAIDKFMDEHLRKNLNLVFCTSAGNAGPGLSTMGTPSAAAEAISIGAVLAPDSARDVQGFTLDAPVVTVFSSRGGETAKPDFAVPGWSTSTVPRWVQRGDYWSGTSMASPYAAGLCALLLSHAQTAHPGTTVRANDVRRALQLASTPPAKATPLDTGYGIPNVGQAAGLLVKRIAAAAGDPVMSYEISTPCPHGHKGRAAAAYWRSTYFPTSERQTFRVTPVFAPGVDKAAQTAFTRKFTLRSLTPWCKLTQESVYLRSAQPANIFVEYDGDQLSEPGVHVGVVEAVADGVEAFRLYNTIVVPYRFTAEDGFARSFEGCETDGWSPDRYFVAVPPGAGGMRITLTAPDGVESEASIERIFNPNGHQLRRRGNRLDTAQGKREVTWSLTEELMPGVWEIDVVSDRPDRNWPYDMKVQFFGLEATPAKVTECAKATRKPEGEIRVTNRFDLPLLTVADGRLEGFRTHKEETFKGLDDEITVKIELEDGYSSVRMHVRLDPEDYGEVTDIGVSLKDSDGEDVYFSAFDYHEFEGTYTLGDAGAATTLTLKIHAGFAVADDERKTPVTIDVDRLLVSPIDLDVEHGGSARINFAPAVPMTVEFTAQSALPVAPKGTQPVGYLRFRERGSSDEALRVPIALEE